MYIYIYIYAYQGTCSVLRHHLLGQQQPGDEAVEHERHADGEGLRSVSILSLSLYIYIYTHVYRERESYTNYIYIYIYVYIDRYIHTYGCVLQSGAESLASRLRPCMRSETSRGRSSDASKAPLEPGCNFPEPHSKKEPHSEQASGV